MQTNIEIEINILVDSKTVSCLNPKISRGILSVRNSCRALCCSVKKVKFDFLFISKGVFSTSSVPPNDVDGGDCRNMTHIFINESQQYFILYQMKLTIMRMNHW